MVSVLRLRRRVREVRVMSLEFFKKKCFGRYSCWRQTRVSCSVAAECRLRRIAEDMKAGKIMHCQRCLGTGCLSAQWGIGETGIVPLVPCPVCHGLGYVVARRGEVSE